MNPKECSTLDIMNPSQISKTQVPNTSISGSPFISNKDAKLRRKRTQSKLTFLKNPLTKKRKNVASDSVNSCEELESVEEGREKFTLLTNEVQTSSDNMSGDGSSEKQEIHLDVCPVCWKTFANRDKVLHMKTCAAKHNLTLKQLLNAVDLQNKQVEERRILGLPCVPAMSSAKKVSSKKNSSTADKNDPDLQLGLALSVSMRENEEQKHLIKQEIMIEAGLGDEVAANQASLLEKYGFTSTKPVLPSVYSHPKQGKYKWKTVPQLLSRSQEERERLITEKVAIVLTNEGGSETPFVLQGNNSEVHVVGKLQSGVLLELQSKECHLWKKASLSPSLDSDLYYVQPLGHIISPSKIKTCCKALRLSQVPCRLKSPPSSSTIDLECSITPISRDTVPISRCDSLKMRTVLESKLLFEDRKNNEGVLLNLHPVPSQLQSQDGTIQSSSKDSKMNITPETESKVPVRMSYSYAKHGCGKNEVIENNLSEKVERNVQFLATLCNNWMKLLNNECKSDILIRVKDGQIIYAHEVVFFARCANVLVDVKEDNSVKYLNWKEISLKSALAFLSYVYSGSSCKVDELVENVNEVVYLSRKYHCTELSSYLNCSNDLCFETACCDSYIGLNDRNKFEDNMSVVQPDISTLLSSNKYTTKSCEETEREKEDRYLNVDTVQDRKDSPVRMYSTWRNGKYHKSANSPDPFNDICDPEVISIPCDQVSSISNSQLGIDYHLETLALQPQSFVAKKEFNGDKSFSSADNSMHMVPTNDGRNILNSVSTLKEISMNRGTYTEREKSIESVNTTEEINIRPETCNSNESKYNADNCSTGEKLNIEDIVFLEHTSFDVHGTPSIKRRRSSTSNTSETMQRWDNNRTSTRLLLDKFCDQGDDILLNKEIEINGSFNQSTSVNPSNGSIIEIRRLLSNNMPCDAKEFPCSQIELKNVKKETDVWHSASIQNTLNHSSNENFVDISDSDIDNFCTGSDLPNLNAIGSPNSSPNYVNEYMEECGKIVKSVDENCKYSSLPSLSRGNSPLSNQSKSYTQTFGLRRTRSTSEISVISDSSSPISVKCLSQTSIHLKSSSNLPEQNICVLPAHDIESAVLNSNISAKETLTSPAAPSTPAVKTHNSSLHSVKRLLESSFISDIDMNFMEGISDDFRNVPCSTPVATVPRMLALNKELQSGGCCVTPVADYSGMNTPALKKELLKYGLKPLKRPKAKQILRHIYDELHPLVPADCKSSTKRSQDNMFSITSPRKKSSENPSYTTPYVKQCNPEGSPTKNTESSGNELNESFHLTQGSSSSPCEFEDPEDSSEDSSEIERSEFRSIVRNYIKRDMKLYEQMLLYKPILVEDLQDALKAENHKFKLSHLMQVMDEECITYQSSQVAKTRQRKKRLRKGA